MTVHCGIDFLSSGSVAALNVERAGKTQLVQRNEMEPAGTRREVKQQTCR